MQLDFTWDIKAEEEYIESYVWYEKQQKGLGEKFISSIESTLSHISKYPLHYPKRKKNYREATISIFPFTIVYEVLKERNLIYVASIFHGKRNPKFKYRKFKLTNQ